VNWNGRNHGTLTRVSSLNDVIVMMIRDFGTGEPYLPKSSITETMKNTAELRVDIP
jgi:hypothetical protein